ncbi:MAG: hypothetical protein HY289_07215 [Planctomycetes bacterium]|nr:hypothetical protein [Planctomycetota bacterium]
MSILFACPKCKVQVEVADEYAGQSGQCPRCEGVITIPSPTQPAPSASPAPSPSPRPVATAVPVPMHESDEWDRPRRREHDEPPPRRRRLATGPPQPAGPIWPWIVGVFAAVVVAGLLFSSFLVLVLWRPSVPVRRVDDMKPNPIVEAKPAPAPAPVANPDCVIAGRREGNRVILDQNGTFQIQADLRQFDPRDLDHPNSAARVFDIQLLANREYEFELATGAFDSELRIEDLKGPLQGMVQTGRRGVDNARLVYRPNFTDTFSIHVTSPNQGLGGFTLTVRETGVKKF